ncbi:hypothetical protein [Streptomyces sp. NPDC059215]|uniref:hypothetical protein n=1 Tax=Streptomyces sp. NPDC059215 TaxID=3346772 RepID=UPI0036982A48
MAKRKQQQHRGTRPAKRLGTVHAAGLTDRLRELHELGGDPELERFPDPEELLLVLLHAERAAGKLVQPEQQPINIAGEAALLRTKLWQHLRELADAKQLRAIEDGRAAGVPWDHFAEPLCVTSKQGAYQKARRLKAEQLREPGEWRTPEVATMREQRALAEERAERARVTEQVGRFSLAVRVGQMLVDHRDGLVVSGMSRYWLEEIEETIDDRTTAAERANFSGFIESFVRNILQLSKETGQSAAGTPGAQQALEKAIEFTLQQRPTIEQCGGEPDRRG